MKNDKELYISRELSWLDFNARVLDEAFCIANPLLERLKFIAIFSGNLDEFFMVRIAGLRQLVAIGNDLPDAAGNRPSEQLKLCRKKIDKLVKKQYRCLADDLLVQLEGQGVKICQLDELSTIARTEIAAYFRNQILPVLTPLAVDGAHPFPILTSGAIEIAVRMHAPHKQGVVYAFVEVPEVLPRFVPIRSIDNVKTFVLLEDLIMDNLAELFTGCEILDFFPFRVTRDMDFSVEDDGAEDLMRSIEKKLLQRRQRDCIRLEFPQEVKGALLDWLKGQFELEEQFCYSVRGPLHLKQLFELIGKVQKPELLEANWLPLMPEVFSAYPSTFAAIAAKGPILIAPPYHSFAPIIKLLEEAATDPDVLAIKQTLYRVSGNSPVVSALRRAAENGKQVSVVVELKARFDEGNNIAWARLLEESGVHVIYGVSGLKIHCKALMIVRREEGAIRRYVHLSTGNYNDKTATLYTDLGIMSTDEDLCFDIANLFNVLTGYSAPPASWRKISASPFDMRHRLSELIEREIAHTSPDAPGRIIAKMNSLSDIDIVRLLHKAADAGVEIDLIVRGICCYRPKSGQDNVRVISIVDRFLEHTRAFYFRNGGAEEYYLASADWMFRNLDRRVELLFPIEDEKLRAVIMDLLQMQLNDSEKSRRLLASGVYTKALPDKHTEFRSQDNSYRYFKHLEAEARSMVTADAFTIFSSK